MKILVAEDNLISRELLKKHLSSWGYEVVAVSDGIAARTALFGEQPPQLSLVDWMMPKLEGPDLIKECRANPQTATHHFILLSGRDSKVDISLGLEAGADDYVTKPYDTLELKARVAVGARMVLLREAAFRQDEVLRELHRLVTNSQPEPLSRAILRLLSKGGSDSPPKVKEVA